MVQGRGRFFEHFGVSLNLSLQSSAEEKKVDSRLDVDEAASVLNAMTKLSQKHKNAFAGRTGTFRTTPTLATLMCRRWRSPSRRTTTSKHHESVVFLHY